MVTSSLIRVLMRIQISVIRFCFAISIHTQQRSLYIWPCLLFSYAFDLLSVSRDHAFTEGQDVEAHKWVLTRYISIVFTHSCSQLTSV